MGETARGQQETIVSSKAVTENLNLKFRLKFNQGFTNHDCLHCAVLKVLYDFKEKGAHKEKYSQIFFKLEF